VLRRFGQYIRLNQALKKKAITASIYPVLLLSVMLGLVALLMLFVVPSFENFFEGLGVDLPLPTRVLMTVAGAASANIGWIATIGLLLIVIGTLWVRTGNRAAAIDGLLLRMPYIGPLMRMYATSQLARSLATLLAGGLPLVNALEVAASSVGNRAMGAAVEKTTQLIREGESLTTALESTRMLESLTLEMVKVGEQTGALSEMLQSIAEFYDEDLETRLETVLALVEPLLLILMAVIVSGMLLAFYLPLFQAISALSGRL
jgi:type IV pilus assembly protein PilC